MDLWMKQTLNKVLKALWLESLRMASLGHQRSPMWHSTWEIQALSSHKKKGGGKREKIRPQMLKGSRKPRQRPKPKVKEMIKPLVKQSQKQRQNQRQNQRNLIQVQKMIKVSRISMMCL